MTPADRWLLVLALATMALGLGLAVVVATVRLQDWVDGE